LIHYSKKLANKKNPLFLYFAIFLCNAFAKYHYKPVYSYPSRLGFDVDLQIGKVWKHTTNFRPTINGPSYAVTLMCSNKPMAVKLAEKIALS
jgi:hypothetical protein